MDPLVVVAVVFLACLATWLVRGLWDESRARRARLDRLLRGHRLDVAIEAERAEARRRVALDEADMAWSSERRPKIVDLSAWRARRRQGNGAA